MQEENDMPHVLPESHELVGSYEKLEMGSAEQEKRRADVFKHLDAMTDALETIKITMSKNETFKTNFLSNDEDIRTMAQVQAIMLQHIGVEQDDLLLLRKAVMGIDEAIQQVFRNMGAHVVLAIRADLAQERPQQDMTPSIELPPIDLLNPVLPRDPRLYENRNMPRPPESATGHFNQNDPLSPMYDPNGGLQVSMS